MRLRNTHHAFTLIELLVVVAIIVTLLAILLPSMQKSIGLAQTAACLSNHRQVLIAWRGYSFDARGAHLPSWQTSGGWASGSGKHWHVTLRPYFDTAKGILICPSVERPVVAPNSGVAATATSAYFTNTPPHLGGEDDDFGAYAYNNWLEDLSGSGWSDATNAMPSVSAATGVPASDVPVVGGGTWADGGWVRETDTMWDNHQNPGTGGPGYIMRFALNRHDGATGVGMMDGSSRRVTYDDLYTLRWHRDWQ